MAESSLLAFAAALPSFAVRMWLQFQLPEKYFAPLMLWPWLLLETQETLHQTSCWLLLQSTVRSKNGKGALSFLLRQLM